MTEQELYNLIIKLPRYAGMIRNSSDQYDRIDWYLPQLNEHYEGKCRSENYYSHMIEYQKYDYLIQQDNPFYICSQPNNIYVYNLNEYPYQYIDWRYEWLPASTEFSRRRKVKKYVGYLNSGFDCCIDILPQLS